MGIKIHYKGSIRDLVLIEKLLEERVDICRAMYCDYQLWNEDITKPIHAKLTQKKGGAGR